MRYERNRKRRLFAVLAVACVTYFSLTVAHSTKVVLAASCPLQIATAIQCSATGVVTYVWSQLCCTPE